ncbi:putative transposase [Senna tora]|uniref:Putative transposase n=1 Tax=Senna tora TaxID=362788 RepID=A0A834XHI7_9FABA|nr:putative transposase [Senna tora]
MKKGETFKEKVLACDRKAKSPSIRNGFNFYLQAKSNTDLLRQFKKVKREKVHNMQERLLESKLKESKGGCHQRQCQKKPPLPKTSIEVESQRVQGDQSQYNKVDTTKKPNQNVAEVQQSKKAPHVPKKLKRKPMSPPLSMDDFLGIVESDIEEIMMNEEVEQNEIEQNEEDNNHHNEVEEENNGDITIGTSKKRTRGKTSCKNIHARSIEEREEVILNDDGQPIGSREKTVKDLSLFLGTMARNSTFCPLTYTNWKAMPSDLKDHMWKYINLTMHKMLRGNLHASNPDKGQLGDKDASFYEAH